MEATAAEINNETSNNAVINSSIVDGQLCDTEIAKNDDVPGDDVKVDSPEDTESPFSMSVKNSDGEEVDSSVVDSKSITGDVFKGNVDEPEEDSQPTIIKDTSNIFTTPLSNGDIEPSSNLPVTTLSPSAIFSGNVSFRNQNSVSVYSSPTMAVTVSMVSDNNYRKMIDDINDNRLQPTDYLSVNEMLIVQNMLQTSSSISVLDKRLALRKTLEEIYLGEQCLAYKKVLKMKSTKTNKRSFTSAKRNELKVLAGERSLESYMQAAGIPSVKNHANLTMDRILKIDYACDLLKINKSQDPIGDFLNLHKLDKTMHVDNKIFNRHVDAAIAIIKCKYRGILINEDYVISLVVSCGFNFRNSDFDYMKDLPISGACPNLYLQALMDNDGKRPTRMKDQEVGNKLSYQRQSSMLQDIIKKIVADTKILKTLETTDIDNLLEAVVALKEHFLKV